MQKYIDKKRLKINEKLKLHLSNIILTHHTPLAANYGTKPRTNEAKLVNRIESLDAEFEELIS